MDKKLIVQVIVVAVVLLFITQTFFLGGGRLGQDNGGDIFSGENVTGIITFNGTIRTYDPFLLIPLETDQAVLDDIRDMDGVRAIRPDTQGYVVDTETRDEVHMIAEELRAINVSSFTIANIAAPTIMEMQYGAQTLNISSQGVVRVVTEPILDAGEEVTVSMVGIANGGTLIDYYNQQIMLQTVQLEIEAEVGELNHIIYIYSIPWEERNNVSNATGEYDRVDALVFDPPLDVSQVMVKKQFPYITYIDAGSAQVLSGFDNKSQVLTNFADVNVTFPPSKLTIKTDDELDLPYEGTERYSYNLTLHHPEGYTLSQTSITFESGIELSGKVTLSATGVAAGSAVISLSGFTLPS